MLRVIGSVVLALTMGACAETVTTMPDAAVLHQIASGGQSALVLNGSSDLGCIDTRIWIGGRTDSGETVSAYVDTLFDAGYATSEPAVLAVAPGMYFVQSDFCRTLSNDYEFALETRRPLGVVSVRAGEVVYPGTLVKYPTEITHRTGTIWGSEYDITGAILVTDLVPNDDVAERINSRYPELAGKVVYRMPRGLTVASQHQEAIRRAFSPDETGVFPTHEEAMAKLGSQSAGPPVAVKEGPPVIVPAS